MVRPRGTIEDVDEARVASVSTYAGQPIAACLVLSATDLRQLGIDLESQVGVKYWVDSENNHLHLTGIDASE